MNELEIPVQIPLNISKRSADSLQRQICAQLRELISAGHLRPGTRLTSIREMAVQLGVSFNTVKLAYQQLISEGHLVTSEAKGTFVAPVSPEQRVFLGSPPTTAPSPERHAARFPPPFRGRSQINPRRKADPGAIDFWAGRTDPRSFPIREWRHLINAQLQHAGANLTDYGDAAGLDALRSAIAGHLARARGFRPDPRQVVVTAGIQEALSISARLFLEPSSTAVTEAPCYKGASYVFESFGARIVRVGIDEEGIRVDRLPAQRAAIVYVTPSHQYPLGHIMSMERRHALLEWAATSGAYVLEDDYDCDFRFENSPLPALAALDKRGSVIYLGTFSKAMGVGLRLGYMVLPHELVEPATTVKALFSYCQPWLVQAAMAEFIASGDYARRLRQVRHDQKVRRDCLRDALQRNFGDVKLKGLRGGMHVVWHLPPEFPPASEVQRAAAEHRVNVYNPEAGGADVTECRTLNERLLVFGYASLSSVEIMEGISRLAQAICC
ncbi:MAG: PLP-dependent aminotransferase family protein [Gammaproteobacteria bacterium]|nr:PLP-dependent aminotransferase family protein [Gammaproteobacteria bacterium]